VSVSLEATGSVCLWLSTFFCRTRLSHLSCLWFAPHASLPGSVNLALLPCLLALLCLLRVQSSYCLHLLVKFLIINRKWDAGCQIRDFPFLPANSSHCAQFVKGSGTRTVSITQLMCRMIWVQHAVKGCVFWAWRAENYKCMLMINHRSWAANYHTNECPEAPAPPGKPPKHAEESISSHPAVSASHECVVQIGSAPQTSDRKENQRLRPRTKMKKYLYTSFQSSSYRQTALSLRATWFLQYEEISGGQPDVYSNKTSFTNHRDAFVVLSVT